MGWHIVKYGICQPFSLKFTFIGVNLPCTFENMHQYERKLGENY